MAELLIDGRTVESAWWGERTPCALVLLHEGLGSVGLWRDFPARLAARTGLGVFAWSRFGYGNSATVSLPRPLDYMEREAALFPGLLDGAGIGPCVLIGHSDGATIAALADDLRILGRVLIAPHYFVEEMALAEIARARDAYAAGDLRTRLARHHRDVDAAFLGWNGAWLDPGFPAALDLRPALADIRVPVLQIQGEGDMYGTTAQLALAEATVPAPVRTVLVPGARHAPHLEAAEATFDAVDAWLREFDLKPSGPKTAAAPPA